MRAMLLLGSLATVATLGYVYGPELVAWYYEKNEPAPPPVMAVSEDVTKRDGETFEVKRPTDDVKEQIRQIQQSIPVAKPALPKAERKKAKAEPAAPKKHKGKRSKKKDTAELGDEAESAATYAELKDMGLSPAAEPTAAPQRAKLVVGRPPQAAPSRWVNELSGPNAHLRMGVKARGDKSCTSAQSNCEREAAPKDISVAGVVVRTEKVLANPEEPLDGNVRTGNYLDHTPAVYVE